MRWSPLWAVIVVTFPFNDYLAAQGQGSSEKPLVYRVPLGNPWVTPVTAEFIKNAIQEAAAQKAECVVLVLNLSGGLLDSTRSVVQTIADSPVPVIVYVSPEGAEAARAGFYVALAGQFVALAPGTSIGPAFAADVDYLPAFSDTTPDVIERSIAHTEVWAKVLEKRHGRNGGQAAELVTDHLSMSADRAVHGGVANLLADNFDDLLLKIHGRKVRLSGEYKVLNTRGATVQELAMSSPQQCLAVIANPDIPFAAMLLGLCGTLVCLSLERWRWAGYVSLAILTAGLVSLNMLPIQYAGAGMIVLGCAFFVAAVFVPRFGIFTVLGAACVILGGYGLFESPAGFMRISLWLLAAATASAILTSIYAGRVLGQKRRKFSHGHAGQHHPVAAGHS